MAGTTSTNYTEVVTLVQPYVNAFLDETLTLVNSGAVQKDTNPAFIPQGTTFTARYRNFFTTSGWRAPVANQDTTIDNWSGNNETGVIYRRYKDVGIEDFAALSSGDKTSAPDVARMIVHDYNLSTENQIVGLLGAMFKSGGALESTHIVDATGSPIAPQNISQARAKMGEFGAGFGFLFMHSAVFYNSELQALVNANAADPNLIREFQTSGMTYAGRYGGMNVILNDRLYNATNVYDTYLVRPGAILLAYQMAPKFVAYYDNRLAAGTDVTGYRCASAVHIPGVTWNTTAPSGIAGATDAEIATAANWAKRTGADNKEIGIVCIKSNA